MFPQVSTKCLRRQSSVSSTPVYVCFFSLVMRGWLVFRGFFLMENWKRDFFSCLNQEKRMRGAVLGDETAVARAGCNTSSYCRGWLEGSLHAGNLSIYPRFPACYRRIISWLYLIISILLCCLIDVAG